MLSSIHPLGERVRGNRFGVTSTAFVLASTAAGAALGLALGALGSLLSTVSGEVWWSAAPWLLAAGALLALAADTRVLGLRPLGPHRQVDEDWLEVYRGWLYGAGYGAQLGVGFATIITTAAVHLTFLAALLVASPVGGGFVGGVFGLARGATLLAARRVDTPERLRALHRRMQALSPAASTAVLGGEVIVFVGALALAWGG
jgi:hypothetical protein